MSRWPVAIVTLFCASCRRHPPAASSGDAGAALAVAWTARSSSGRATLQQRGEDSSCVLESSGGAEPWSAPVCAAKADQLAFVSEDGEWLLVLDPLPPVRDGQWQEADAISLFHRGELRIRAPVGDLVRTSKDLHFFIGTVGWLRGTSDLAGSPPRYGPGGDTVVGEVADGSTFSLPFDDRPRPRPPPPPPTPRTPPPTPAAADTGESPALAEPRAFDRTKELNRGKRAIRELVDAGKMISAVEELERLRGLVHDDAAMVRELADFEGKIAIHLLDIGNPSEARRFAGIGVETDADAPRPREAAGRIAYARNEVPAAMTEWNRGLQTNPGDDVLRRLVARGQTDTASLKETSNRSSQHFVLSFDGREDRETADIALALLEEAYQKVPAALYGFTPEDQVPVVLYPNEAFERLEKPRWAGGFFDGKVRTGSAGATTHQGAFRAVLTHEYGHAVLHRATRGQRAPSWFDEGMAQVAARILQPEPALTCGFGHQVPLASLGGGFASLPGDNRQVRAAYLTARHAVEGLLERKGRAAVQDLIRRAGAGEPFDKAFEHAIGQTYSAFLEAFDKKDCAAQSWK